MPCPHIAPTRQPATSHNLLLQLLRPRLPHGASAKISSSSHHRSHTHTHTRTTDELRLTSSPRAPTHTDSRGPTQPRLVKWPPPLCRAALQQSYPPLPPQLARFHTNPRSSVVASSSIHAPLSLSLSCTVPPRRNSSSDDETPRPSIHGAPSIRLGPVDDRRHDIHLSMAGLARLNRLDSMVEAPIPEQDPWAI